MNILAEDADISVSIFSVPTPIGKEDMDALVTEGNVATAPLYHRGGEFSSVFCQFSHSLFMLYTHSLIIHCRYLTLRKIAI